MASVQKAKPMLEAPKVLVVDDEAANVELVERALRREFQVLSTTSGHEALKLMERNSDLAMIISDQRMPEMSGTELLRQSLTLAPDAVRIILTAYSDLEDVLRAVNVAQVNRFLSKPFNPQELTHVVRGAIELYLLRRDKEQLVRQVQEKNEQLRRHEHELDLLIAQRTVELEETNTRLEKANHELRRVNEQLQQVASRDGLTGLYNHRYFQEWIASEVVRSRRFGWPLSLLFVDVDHFKSYNDLNGHQAGDELLRQLARVLTGSAGEGAVRAADVVARYGGEEFAILLTHTDGAGAAEKARRICNAVSQHPFDHAQRQPLGFVSVSIGVASFRLEMPDAHTLIEKADQALYRAKSDGRNCVRVYEP
jgi:diguanylate cyclase (GGDEF)-like protein